jgi:hypothetical protein
MQKLKLFLATIFGGIALLGAALPQSDKPTHSDSDKPKLTFSDDKNAADHPVPTQRMVMIGKQAVVRMTAPGCNDWNVWARVTDLFSNDKEAAIQLLRSSPSCSSFPEGMGVMVEDHSIMRASSCIRPVGSPEACSWVPSATLWPRDQSEWKCSAETKGCEGWKKCGDGGVCEEDPNGQEGTCFRIPTSCGWVFH